MIPAKGEGAAHELPMPSDGFVASHLILRPPQGMLDVFVALLDPHAQARQPDHLFQAGWKERRFPFQAFCWERQVGHQIPGGEVGQALGIGAGHDGPLLLVRPIRPGYDLHGPPILRAPIAKHSRDPHPLARLLGTHPAGLVGHVLEGARYLLRMPPGVGRFERHHIRHPERPSPSSSRDPLQRTSQPPSLKREASPGWPA